MVFRNPALCLLALNAAICTAQSITLPSGTPIPVQIDDHLPMQVGQAIRAKLIYPVYADNTLILPANTVVIGTVTALRSDHAHRIDARLRADFTPFRIPVVHFTDIVLDDGSTVSMTASTATDGAPIYHLVAPPPRKGGFIHQQWDNGRQILRDQLAIITGLDKKDRLVQLLYTQLPYHPQRIQKNTAWTVETSEPLSIPLQTVIEAINTKRVVAPEQKDDSTTKPWIIQAYLRDPLSSATTKTGQEIKATVAEPIYNPDHTIAVPQGASMIGTVTLSKPARRFGRAGALHFDFRQIVLPTGTQNVQTSLTGADSAAGQKLALDSEGQVKPKPQDKIVVPLLLIALASRPLHHDADDGSGLGKNAVASNSLGLIGFLVGTAAGQRNIAAGIGYYGAAISIYERWIKRGHDVTFARDTRVVLQTTPRSSTVLHPDAVTPRLR
jgi:hypothetical protein